MTSVRHLGVMYWSLRLWKEAPKCPQQSRMDGFARNEWKDFNSDGLCFETWITHSISRREALQSQWFVFFGNSYNVSIKDSQLHMKQREQTFL